MSALAAKMAQTRKNRHETEGVSARIELSIIIVSYNNYDILKECLASIKEFNDIGSTLEVIVVEQSPEENIYRKLLSDFSWVTTIRRENNGFGAGNNAGSRVAHGRFLLFLNPDTILIEPVFGFAIKCFESDSRLGMFGVRLVNRDGDRNQSFYFRKPYGLLRGSVLYRICDRFSLFIPNAMYITGADMFVRTKAFTETGGFDERMFMYFEETYLCDKLNNLGYYIAFYPEKRIVHLEGATSAAVNILQRRLDSLKYLCQEKKWSYSSVLKFMRRDRVMKSLLGSDRSAEIALIDSVLNEVKQ
mgnify:CR=1 FL=1|jgi:hypothetical protein